MTTQRVVLPYTPRPLQQSLQDELERYRFGVLLCHRRFGKCLDVDTEIPTPRGYVKLVDLAAGDEVFAADGSITRVRAAHAPLLERVCYRLTFSDGSSVVCDDEHLWFTETKLDRTARDRTASARDAAGAYGLKRRKAGSVKSTAEIVDTLRYCGETNHAVPVCGPLQYPSSELPVDPYLLGAWLGDGTSRAPQITTMDDEIRDAFGALYPLRPARCQGGSKATTYIVGGDFSARLRALGVIPVKYIPRQYLTASVGQRLELLRGLMDTDGSVRPGTRACEITQKREHIAAAIGELLASFGIKYAISQKRAMGGIYFRVTFSAPFDPFRLSRKSASWRSSGGPRFLSHRYIVSAERVPSRPVRCIEIEHPSHLFLCTRSNIPTHNSVFAVVRLILSALLTDRPNPRCAYIAPLYRQAKDVAWDYMKRFTEPIPGRIVNESELRIDFQANGSRIKLYGADNPDSLRGLYLDDVVLDEPGQMQGRVWREVVRPALSDRSGRALFIGTPGGRGFFWELYQQALEAHDWLVRTYPASETLVLPLQELDSARRAMSPEEYDREYECSWSAGQRGAFYARVMEEAERSGRITDVPYDPALSVVTAWDLGMRDSTAIVFAQPHHSGPRIIDYYQSEGVGLNHYAKALQEKPYIYGDHIAPHDIEVRELGTGRSRRETAAQLGINFRVAPNLPRMDGIEAARNLIPLCWFDRNKCKGLIEALQSYRAEINARTDELLPTPLHDWSEHGASAFRYLAVSMNEPRGGARRPKPDTRWVV